MNKFKTHLFVYILLEFLAQNILLLISYGWLLEAYQMINIRNYFEQLFPTVWGSRGRVRRALVAVRMQIALNELHLGSIIA